MTIGDILSITGVVAVLGGFALACRIGMKQMEATDNRRRDALRTLGLWPNDDIPWHDDLDLADDIVAMGTNPEQIIVGVGAAALRALATRHPAGPVGTVNFGGATVVPISRLWTKEYALAGTVEAAKITKKHHRFLTDIGKLIEAGEAFLNAETDRVDNGYAPSDAVLTLAVTH